MRTLQIVIVTSVSVLSLWALAGCGPASNHWFWVLAFLAWAPTPSGLHERVWLGAFLLLAAAFAWNTFAAPAEIDLAPAYAVLSVLCVIKLFLSSPAAGVSAIACIVLALAAVPNYMCFSCKSKQSEAKTNLSGLFTAEKSFFGEYGTYSTDLVSVNWFPDGAPTYAYGIYTSATEPTYLTRHDVIKDYDETRWSTLDPRVVGDRYVNTKVYGSPYLEMLLTIGPELEEPYGFTAMAVANFDDDATYDIWTIDSRRNLRNIMNDCTD